ncbi:hypothetical protein [uncultured Adlercreutzia sp.]|nr:hypothetical protein [uncultured Adlercreutzia sp.]
MVAAFARLAAGLVALVPIRLGIDLDADLTEIVINLLAVGVLVCPW